MNNISIEKLDFHDWSVNRRARMLDHMDQYIRKNIGVDSSAYFYWENHGIGNKSDKEVLEIAQDDVKFINVIFAFWITIDDDDIFTIKKERF